MLNFIGNTLINVIEQELIKNEPAMQAFIINQLSDAASMLSEYFSGKLSEITNEIPVPIINEELK